MVRHTLVNNIAANARLCDHIGIILCDHIVQDCAIILGHYMSRANSNGGDWKIILDTLLFFW